VTPGPGDDLVEFGRDRPAGGRWRARALLACLGLATAITIAVHAAGHHARPQPRIPASPPPPQVLVMVIGHRLLGQTADWQLFARGPDDLLRIQFAQGRVTRTYVPLLQTSIPAVALVIGAHEAVIRSADFVPGYVVPDGANARVLTGPLAGGGPLIPGPPGSQAAWVTTGSRTSSVLSLITLTGRRSGPVIRFRARQLPATAVSDGRGDVLVTTGPFAVVDAGPGWHRRLPGAIIAVGQDGWLAVTCRAQFPRCREEVVDSADRVRRILPGHAGAESYYFSWPPIGVIAPDGTTAAVPESGSGGTLTVHLIDLRTGMTRNLDVRIGAPGSNQSPDGGQQSMVWSPDSRWLFVAAVGGHLVVINARTGRTVSLGVKLPAVDQVAVRR